MNTGKDAATLEVVQVAAPGRFGGLESVVGLLASGLASRGHRVRLVALYGPDRSERCLAFDGLEASGVVVEAVHLPPRSYREERRVIARAIEPAGAVVHSHGYHADVVAVSAARSLKRPAVATVHGFTGGGLKNRVYEWIGCRALRRCSAVVAVARPVHDRLIRRGVPERLIQVVPNAFPANGERLDRASARDALGIPGGDRVVGWVGRLTAEKAPDVFLRAMAALPEAVSASVVGDGPMRSTLEAWAAGAGLANRVRWHGGVAKAGPLFPAFDVLVISSWTEGTPMVLFEAMNAGVPVVATAVGGVPDVVGPGEAILVGPGDAAGLAAAVATCLDDPAGTRVRTRAARSRLETVYGPAAWLDRHEAIYRGVS